MHLELSILEICSFVGLILALLDFTGWSIKLEDVIDSKRDTLKNWLHVQSSRSFTKRLYKNALVQPLLILGALILAINGINIPKDGTYSLIVLTLPPFDSESFTRDPYETVDCVLTPTDCSCDPDWCTDDEYQTEGPTGDKTKIRKDYQRGVIGNAIINCMVLAILAKFGLRILHVFLHVFLGFMHLLNKPRAGTVGTIGLLLAISTFILEHWR